jgi:AcrR family transcriptional regulator
MTDSRRTRRTRNSLAIPGILDAAELVASSGMQSLTIRAVADELGSSPMGLYRYVAGKEELVEALLDRVLGRMPVVSETEDPLADLAAFATAHRDLLLAHPWAVPGLIAHPMPGPNAVPIGEQALRILHRAGVDDDRAVATFSGVIALNYGWVSFSIARSAAEAAPSLRRIASGPGGDFPYTIAVGEAMGRFGGDDHYVIVLTELLSGLAERNVPAG